MLKKAQMIGDNLRAMRARERMSQEELAKKIGVSTSTIINWEGGKGGIGLDKACALADLFGCPLDDLAGRTDDQEQTAQA